MEKEGRTEGRGKRERRKVAEKDRRKDTKDKF